MGKLMVRLISISDRTTDPTKPLDTFVNIEYLTWPIIRYKREVLFGWVDLLVSFGGIAGLFLGFSLLSGVEIVYYFTLRAFCMLYKNRVDICFLLKADSDFISHFFICRNSQDELYAIEEEKLSKPQKHIDLSLKVIEPSTIAVDRIRKIEVAETKPQMQNVEIKRMDRVARKMETVKVSTKLFELFLNLLDGDITSVQTDAAAATQTNYELRLCTSERTILYALNAPLQ